MNLQTRYPTTADEFLRWNEGREGKREFVRGKVVELMIHVTRNHMRIATRLVAQLVKHLDATRFDVGTADFGVKTSDGVRFPDVLVDRIDEASRGEDLAATAPVMLAEILSPSSYSRDFGEKVVDYTGLPSLLHYLILSQDEPRAWLWSRDYNSVWNGPLQIAGNANLELKGLGISLALPDLYRGVLGPTSNA
jgi:Uma2 family endonuclease